jgi:hypothetical protein
MAVPRVRPGETVHGFDKAARIAKIATTDQIAFEIIAAFAA